MVRVPAKRWSSATERFASAVARLATHVPCVLCALFVCLKCLPLHSNYYMSASHPRLATHVPYVLCPVSCVCEREPDCLPFPVFSLHLPDHTRALSSVCPPLSC